MSQSETKTMPEAVEVKRYDRYYDGMDECSDGVWVKFDDYASLKAECGRLTEEVLTQDRTIDSLRGNIDNLADENSALTAEVATLTEQLAAQKAECESLKQTVHLLSLADKQVQQLKAYCEYLTNELEGIHKDRMELSFENTKLKEECDRLQKRLLDFEGMTFSENEKITELKAECERLKKEKP